MTLFEWFSLYINRRFTKHAFPAVIVLFGLACTFLMVSCVPSTGSPPVSPGAAGVIADNDEEPIDMDDALVRDAVAFAEYQEISLEEALMRLEHQQTIGDIQPALESNLSDTYGGLWVEHQPEYRIVIALTEGDESTIQPYIEGKSWAEFVEVRQVNFTLLELKDAQRTASLAANNLNVSVSSGIDVIQNRVEIRVGNPDLFRADLAAAGIDLPEPIEILPIDQEKPLPNTNQGVLLEATTADGRTIFLPNQPPASDSMAALIEGKLIEENGCLRVTSEGYENGFLILWPFVSDIRVAGERIDVLNGDAQVVARVGEWLRIGGGAMESSASVARIDDTLPGMPIDGCPGPYWVAGELETLAAQAIPDIYINPFSSGDQILATFIYQSRPSTAEGSLTGELMVDEQGCLRVEEHVIFWPPGSYLLENPLRVVGKNREEIARIGEITNIEGAEKTSQDYRYFDNKVRCPGPYWGTSAETP